MHTYIPLHTITYHYIPLHTITLHYITLHAYIVAVARVSLFHPQTKTNYEDEFPEDELPPEDEWLPEDEFPEDEFLPEEESLPEDWFRRRNGFSSRRRIQKTTCPPKTNSLPKTNCSRRRTLSRRPDQTKECRFENVRWGLYTCPWCLPRQRLQTHGKHDARCEGVKYIEVRQVLQCAHYTVQ